METGKMEKPPILLIHGTWCSGESWNDFAKALQKQGFEVHTPTLRHHGIFKAKAEWLENAKKVGTVGLLDYVSDLKKYAEKMAKPPIIIGHSLGGLLAQLLAVRIPNQGLVLLGTAPAAGIFAFYPNQVRAWGPYLWRALAQKPMFPTSFKNWGKFTCNVQCERRRKETYQTLCAESGRAYFEMCLWFLDRKRAAKVDFDKVRSPVLVIGASKDKCTGSGMSLATARKYGDKALFVEIQGSDHMMNIGPYMPETLKIFEGWVKNIGIC
ncbi:alpha/beta hydrolase [Acetobacteraceae bacterium]|nr:alpha/beta hydrolase [Acetobacteraceae bacterium]